MVRDQGAYGPNAEDVEAHADEGRIGKGDRSGTDADLNRKTL